VLSFSRIVSLSSVVAALALPALIWIAGYSQTTAYMGLGVLAALLVVWRHRGNIKRLLAGTEPKIGKRSSQAHDSAPPP
jgi:glycerol-3-phosphate acyltransferase PlsY